MSERIRPLPSNIKRNEDGKLVLPLIPLRGLTIFPNMVLHFDIGREKSINAMEKAMIADQYIFLVTQKDETTDLPTREDFYEIVSIPKDEGTEAQMGGLKDDNKDRDMEKLEFLRKKQLVA